MKNVDAQRGSYTQHVLAACFIDQHAAFRLSEVANQGHDYWFMKN